MSDFGASTEQPRLSIPRNWTVSIQAAMLQVIALAQYALAYTGNGVANGRERVRLAARADRADQEAA